MVSVQKFHYNFQREADQPRKTPRYPIVLCHGLSGFDRLMLWPSWHWKGENRIGGVYLDYWKGISEALESIGCTVYISKVLPFGSISQRAKMLNEYLESRISESSRIRPKKTKVNLVAHSMGGLDCRYLISEIESKNYQVVSLTTVATPHHGSSMADYCCERMGMLPPSIKQLTTQYMVHFNKKVLNHPNVQYFSFGASFRPKFYNLFFSTWNVVKENEGSNDGLVSVKSAQWGKYLGTLRGVDHLDLINWTSINKNVSSFNAVEFYLDLADYLARQGL